MLTLKNPCPGCIVYSCCTQECNEYNQFIRTLTNFMPAVTITLAGIIFLITTIVLYSKLEGSEANKIIFYYQLVCAGIMLYFLRKQKYTGGALGLTILLILSPIFGPTLLVGNIICKCVGPVKAPKKERTT